MFQKRFIEKLSEHGQEITQSHTADQPTAESLALYVESIV